MILEYSPNSLSADSVVSLMEESDRQGSEQGADVTSVESGGFR